MKKKDIEVQIYHEFNNSKPELFQEIMEQCPKMTESTKTSFWNRFSNIFKQQRFRYSFVSAFLIIALVFSTILFNTGDNGNPYSVVALDVNPSIVLELDEDDRVIDVIKENADAEVIVGSMDLIGVDADVVINALIGSMVANGYITDLSNSILLSVQSNDLTKEEEILSRFTSAINALLTGSSINGSVMTQKLDLSDDAEELAETLEISEAKAELIIRITNIDPRMIVEDLAKLSINDLNLLLESKNYNIDSVTHTGKASNLEIISANEAYQIALTHFGIDEVNVLEYEVELEQEDGIMVYDIELETSTTEYSILINAKAGLVYESEQETNDEEDSSDELTESDQDSVLSVSEIITLIADELGLNYSNIHEIEAGLEKENDVVFYEVSFVYSEREYELEVDAISGTIYSNSLDEDGYGNDEIDEDDLEDEED